MISPLGCDNIVRAEFAQIELHLFVKAASDFFFMSSFYSMTIQRYHGVHPSKGALPGLAYLIF